MRLPPPPQDAAATPDAGEVGENRERRSEEFREIGEIAAGIAHEINTPVQFIGDNVGFLKEAFEALSGLVETYRALVDPRHRHKVRDAETAVDLEFVLEEVPGAIARTLDGVSRVAEIARAVREFSHPDPAEKVAVDLNAVLRNTFVVSRNEYKYVADLEMEPGELPPVFCYPGQLSRAFLNLIVNAAHSISEAVEQPGDRGVISISTRCDGETVSVSIRDSGVGVPEQIRERIFEPFFTTKEAGRGTGQGLAIARACVVDRHFGTIDLDSEPGRGTTFRVRLPVDGESPVGS